MQTVSFNEQSKETIVVGDYVEIKTQNNEDIGFIVLELNEKQIIGENHIVDIAEITEIRVKRISKTKTAITVILSVALVVVAVKGAQSIKDAPDEIVEMIENAFN